MEKVEVPTNAGKLINAVARIGYDPEVAICDLIDNCIDADATSIDVKLKKNGQEGQSDIISSYVITDNGVGMDSDTLIGAFTLGTDREYRPRSLGKFGIGLKSAGLSLGNEITIITRAADSEPICARLSMSDVEQSGRYEIDLGEVPDEMHAVWEAAGIEAHGTVLLIRQLTDGQPPHADFQDYLKRYCSVVYHRFLESTVQPLSMTIGETTLQPFDPLFMEEARRDPLVPQTWDGKTPHLLLEDKIPLVGNEVTAYVAATHLVHPPSFEPDERRRAQEDYAIVVDPYTRRSRHGFYVYRNERVIALAERFHGLVPASTQYQAFRARLMFDESADAVLSLDVKKRHCRLPRGVRQNLKARIERYATTSNEAWRHAGGEGEKRRGETSDTRANESIAETPVPDLDYMPGSDPSDHEALNTRKKRQEDIAGEAEAAVQDPKGIEKLERGAKGGDVVVPIDGLRKNAMWWPYPSIKLNRAKTLVNKNHTWVAEAYKASEDSPDITIVLHHLFTILARAELEVRAMPDPSIRQEHVDKTFDRFRVRSSTIGEDLADHLAATLRGEMVDDDI